MTKHLAEEQLILHYYGEADQSAPEGATVLASDVETHLHACEECRVRFTSIQQLLNSLDALPVPDRPADYGVSVWKQIEGKVKTRRRFKWLGLPQRWAAIGALAALVVAAFLAGRYSPRPPALVAGGNAPVRERVLLVAVGDHLERSQTILVEIANSSSQGALDITGERVVAENLIESNRLYRQSALATGETGVANMLDDLERVLLEIAHSPDQISGTELEALRHRIEEQGLLFRVKVVGSKLRQPEKMPASSPGSAKL